MNKTKIAQLIVLLLICYMTGPVAYSQENIKDGLEFQSITIEPRVAAPNDKVKVVVIYGLQGIDSPLLAVTERKSLSVGGQEIAVLEKRQVERTNGRWVIETTFLIPASAAMGEYEIQQVVSSQSFSKSLKGSFVVKAASKAVENSMASATSYTKRLKEEVEAEIRAADAVRQNEKVERAKKAAKSQKVEELEKPAKVERVAKVARENSKDRDGEEKIAASVGRQAGKIAGEGQPVIGADPQPQGEKVVAAGHVPVIPEVISDRLEINEGVIIEDVKKRRKPVGQQVDNRLKLHEPTVYNGNQQPKKQEVADYRLVQIKEKRPSKRIVGKKPVAPKVAGKVGKVVQEAGRDSGRLAKQPPRLKTKRVKAGQQQVRGKVEQQAGEVYQSDVENDWLDNQDKVDPRIPKLGKRERLRNGGYGPWLVAFSRGTFSMGGDGENERPVHRVKIEDRFSMMIHEVTVGMYQQYLKSLHGDATKSVQPWVEEYPVTNVSWQDAVKYAAWLSQNSGHTYRLPTEAEWEYVAKYCQKTGSSASSLLDMMGDSEEHDYEEQRMEVTFNSTSDLCMIYGLKGNVWEWVADCWSNRYFASRNSQSAYNRPNCVTRVVRGGSYLDEEDKQTVTKRKAVRQNSGAPTIGFRLVREGSL